MDALGCYDSDDCSTNAEDGDSNSNTDPSPQQPFISSTVTANETNHTQNNIKSESITKLLSVCSDDDVKDKDESTKERRIVLKETSTSKRKRRRRWDNAEAACDEETGVAEDRLLYQNALPLPRLSCSAKGQEDGDNSFDALILFPKDYVTPFVRKYASLHSRTSKEKNGANCNEVRPELATKLDLMYRKFYKPDDIVGGESNVNNGNADNEPKSFASHLKEQKEFGNPNLFPSIIQHFGIDPMGSNLPPDLWDPKNDFEPFEFVERLVEKEQQNRIRQQQQNQD